jgi:hypothetical protein
MEAMNKVSNGFIVYVSVHIDWMLD